MIAENDTSLRRDCKQRNRPSRQSATRSRFRTALIFLQAGYTLGKISVAQAQQTGGSFCDKSFCIDAVVEGNLVTYQLKSEMGVDDLGWMSIGFGDSMVGSPMVVTWPNLDGTITLAQRQAKAQANPQIIRNPQQVATLVLQNCILTKNSTTIAFTYPPPSSLNTVNIIYAYSDTRPGSSPNSILQKHIGDGSFVMDLTKPHAVLPTGTYSPTTYLPTSTASQLTSTTIIPTLDEQKQLRYEDPPLTSDERKLAIHGILMSVGFLILLPFGALIPRYTRTILVFRNKWFTAHWVVQFILSSPIIFAGWALGYQHVGTSGRKHFDDPHQKVGLALIILYLAQITLGAIIHFFKPKFSRPIATEDAAPELKSCRKAETLVTITPATAGTLSTEAISLSIRARPIQNYLHAFMGLSIIGLAFWNVSSGLRHEWGIYTGRTWTSVLSRADKWWLSWVIIIPALYGLGLILLPRQWHQEAVERSAPVILHESGIKETKSCQEQAEFNST